MSELELLLGWTRYEKARKLTPQQWTALHTRNLAGENFDDMIDALPNPLTPVPTAQSSQAPTDWADVGRLLNAESHARGCGLLVGTSNWAAFICKAMGAQSSQVRDAQDAMFIGQHNFSEWNRVQKKPPIPGSTEYLVFENAVRIYLEAINAKGAAS